MEKFMTAGLAEVLAQVHVNLPVFMFKDYFDAFMQMGITPEIGLDCAVLDTVSDDHMRLYAKRLQQAHMRPSLHAPFIGLEPASQNPAKRAQVRHYLQRTLQAVAIFRPDRVVWHTCAARNAPYEDPAFIESYAERLKTTVSWFAAELNALDALLMLENVYEQDCALHLRLLEHLRPFQAGFCLDTGHSHAFGRQPLDIWLKGGLVPYLGEIHLHDNDGVHDAHLGAGSGTVDYLPLLEHLQHLERKDWPLITLEPHTEPDLHLSLNFVKRKFTF